MSEQSKHTPGPWQFVKGNKVEGHEIRGDYKSDDGKTYSALVAYVNAYEPRTKCDVGCGGSSIANAHLIAAAPDLLEACRAFEVYLTTHLVIGKNGKAHDEVTALLESARAAIARAEGGAA